jgi:hypothetical protein
MAVAVRHEGNLLAVYHSQLYNFAELAEVLVDAAADFGTAVWFETGQIESAALAVEAASAHHIISVAAVTLTAEAIVHEVDAVLLRLGRNTVHKGALTTIAAVAAREMQADVGVCARDGLARVERDAAARGRGLSVLEVAVAPVLPDELAVPDVVPKRA